MRVWLPLCLIVLAACDKSSDYPAIDDRDLGLRETATEIATTQGTLTVGDESVAKSFPLPIMPQARVDHVARLQPPGKPVVLQMTLEVQAPMPKVADFYENAMRVKGLKVQRSQSAKDPNQIMLSGESPLASATALINRGVGTKPTTVSVSWNDKQASTPGTSSAPAETQISLP